MILDYLEGMRNTLFSYEISIGIYWKRDANKQVTMKDKSSWIFPGQRAYH